MPAITALRAREILDSRGVPTLETTIMLDTGHWAVASAGADDSPLPYENVVLRDHDPQRFQGLGVLTSVASINRLIAPKIIGQDPTRQGKIDQLLVDLDQTKNKQRFGANTLASVSQAVCKVGAAYLKLPLYDYLRKKYQLLNAKTPFPLPIFNLIEPALHESSSMDFQEFQIILGSAYDFPTALSHGVKIYRLVETFLSAQGLLCGVGEQGGFCPNLFTSRNALDVILETLHQTDYQINHDIFLGLDLSAQLFFADGQYNVKYKNAPLSPETYADFLKNLNAQYHLLIIEDPLHNEDWSGWTELTSQLASSTIVGDTLIAGNLERLKKAVQKKSANCLAVKPQQSGTISEAITLIQLARTSGWKIIVAHSSGETNNDFLADFAVGVGADYVKFGAPVRGERIAKYNRLTAIHAALFASVAASNSA